MAHTEIFIVYQAMITKGYSDVGDQHTSSPASVTNIDVAITKL